MNAFDRVLLAGSVLLVLLLLGPVLTIPLHIPINYNEGWNAGFDTRAMQPSAGPLYPGSDSFVFNNYPPLGFYIVGVAGLVFRDMIVGGRVVALAALFCCAGLLGLCVRQLGGTGRAACAAGLLLLLSTATFYRSYVAMDDPQWLAHAMMLGSLALLLRTGVPRRPEPGGPPPGRMILAALLMVAGGFVKHNLVALPVAVTLWLAWLDRRLAIVWIAAAAAGACAGLGLTGALFGSAAYSDILHHPRVFHAYRLTRAIGGLAPLLPMAIAALALRRRVAGDGAVLVGLFAGVSLLTGIVQRMGEGVNYNAHFETMIAVCLGFGLVLAPLSRSPLPIRRRSIGPAALLVFAALPVVGALPWRLPAAWHEIADRKARQAAWQPMIERLAASRGPAGCEMPSVCIWAGKPFSVDIFNLTQSILSGRSAEPFRRMVARRGYAMFEYDPGSATHRNAIRSLGHDPVIGPFAGIYAPVATGPNGAILLAPIDRPLPAAAAP
ncbi:hypothetical protein [Lichenicoccus sp.]|uniref:hypothetical protein n=1 Tax=Lichenicoccus sp. TaxID=2781899 RepID=UPI003D12632B